ncbi:MAG TPA: DnaJ C-terminal domain-containing protein [Rubrivivax sp.]|nr:DnaJ C-terminal domain-containing protein [Rubrivivax sp.]HPO18111.1 DnaJ C-terminal domain-containing protein [Rubrivivax sp.]
MSTDNAYAELGLSPGASEAEVKAAWRRLVSLWHPDRNSSANAVQKMQRLNEAFEQISRAGFPRAATRRRAEAPPRAEPPAPEPAPSEPASAEPSRAGRTIHRKVELGLEEAALGCTRSLSGRYAAQCTGCSGLGWFVLGGRCKVCAGSGAVRRASLYNWFGARVECEACRGGGIARQPCGDCGETGKLPMQRFQVGVRIPPGVRDGDVLQAAALSSGGERLAIELRVTVRKHEFLELFDDGALRCEVPVDGFAWIAGREVEIPTLAGPRKLKLDRTQLVHRLAGEGFPAQRRGPRGDLWITVVPVFPEPLGAEQRKLLDRLIASNLGRDGQPLQPRLRDWQRRMQGASRTETSG